MLSPPINALTAGGSCELVNEHPDPQRRLRRALLFSTKFFVETVEGVLVKVALRGGTILLPLLNLSMSETAKIVRPHAKKLRRWKSIFVERVFFSQQQTKPLQEANLLV